MFSTLIAALDRNTVALNALTRVGIALFNEGQDMTAAFDNLTAAVTTETTVEASAVTLVQSLAAEVKATSNDPAVQALADKITASSSALAAAVAANTSSSATGATGATGTMGPAPGAAGTTGATGAAGATGA